MQINLFEIVAQMVNFFILLYILHKLFYKPVLKAMDDRQERLALEHAQAENKMIEANELISSYRLQLDEVETTKQDILSIARVEAREHKEKLMEKYSQEAALRRQYFRQEVEDERERFLQEVRRVLGESAVKVAANILTMVTREDLGERTFALFLESVRSADKSALADEARSASLDVVLYSSHELSQEQRQAVESSLAELLGVVSPISYEIDAELVLGYELRFETLTIHKSVRRYLEETEATIRGSLEKAK